MMVWHCMCCLLTIGGSALHMPFVLLLVVGHVIQSSIEHKIRDYPHVGVLRNSESAIEEGRVQNFNKF